METIIVGTKEYAWAVEIFVKLFQRYWGTRLIWYGDGSPDVPDGVEFRSCPAFPEIWPWEHWFGAGIVSIMEDLDSDVFTLFLPDHWITEMVNVRAVNKLAKYVAKNGEILRCDLTRGACARSYGTLYRKLKGIELWEVPVGNPHCSLKVAFSPALWDRRIFKHIPEQHWDLWEVEGLGSSRAADLVSVAAVPGPVARCHGIYRGKEISVEGLGVKDAAMVRSMIPAGWKIRA